MRAVHSRLLALALVCGSVPLAALTAAPIQEWAFGSLEGLKVSNGARAELVTYRGRRARERPPIRAGSSVSRFVFNRAERATKTSTSGRPTDAPTISCAAITRCSTPLSPTTRGLACVKRRLGDTRGGVALWAHASTDAYFSRVIIRPN